ANLLVRVPRALTGHRFLAPVEGGGLPVEEVRGQVLDAISGTYGHGRGPEAGDLAQQVIRENAGDVAQAEQRGELPQVRQVVQAVNDPVGVTKLARRQRLQRAGTTGQRLIERREIDQKLIIGQLGDDVGVDLQARARMVSSEDVHRLTFVAKVGARVSP